MKNLRVIINRENDILIAIPVGSGMRDDLTSNISYENSKLTCTQENNEIFSFFVPEGKNKIFQEAYEDKKITLWEASANGMVVHEKLTFI